MTNTTVSNSEDSGKLKILGINLGRSSAASHTLVSTMAEKNIDLALIQEPYQILTENRLIVPFFNGMTVVNGIRDCTSPPTGLPVWTRGDSIRSCLVARSGITIITVEQFCSRDFSVALLSVAGRPLVLISAYFQFDRSGDGVEQLSGSLRHLDGILDAFPRHDFLLHCDSNSESVIWAPRNRSNKRGEILCDWALAGGVTVLNSCRKPTFVSHDLKRVGYIDVTMAKGRITEWVRDWEVLNDESFSDHRMILISLSVTTEENNFRPASTRKFNLKKADPDLFQEKLMEILETTPPNDLGEARALDSEALHTTESLVRAASECLPCLQVPNTLRPRWWDSELATTKREVNKNRKRFLRYRLCEYSKTQYSDSCTKYKELIKQKKKAQFERFLADNGTSCWDKIKRISSKNRTLPLLRKSNGELCVDLREMTETFLNEIFPPGNKK